MEITPLMRRNLSSIIQNPIIFEKDHNVKCSDGAGGWRPALL